VRISEAEIALEPGMQLTFNGIAQGHAADEVASLLKSEGFTNVLIDTGEIAALGARPDGAAWQAAITLPDGREIRRAALSNMALAVSSPSGTLIGGSKAHIINPMGGAPLWRIAAVSAPRAALADALSTAFCLMPRQAVEAALERFPAARLESLS
jgi:thiamine biosynthesis lipoprotein